MNDEAYYAVISEHGAIDLYRHNDSRRSLYLLIEQIILNIRGSLPNSALAPILEAIRSSHVL